MRSCLSVLVTGTCASQRAFAFLSVVDRRRVRGHPLGPCMNDMCRTFVRVGPSVCAFPKEWVLPYNSSCSGFVQFCDP